RNSGLDLGANGRVLLLPRCALQAQVLMQLADRNRVLIREGRPSGRQTMFSRKLATGLVALVLLACWASVPALAESHARIVRLSYVQGSVMIDRNTGDGFEKAFLNMPVTEGMALETKDGGRAEVEFEDGSV